MLKQLAGSSLSDEDCSSIIEKSLSEMKCSIGLNREAFQEALKNADLSNMQVQIPIEY